METRELVTVLLSLVVATMAFLFRSLHGDFKETQGKVNAHEREMGVLKERADNIIKKLDDMVHELREQNSRHNGCDTAVQIRRLVEILEAKRA